MAKSQETQIEVYRFQSPILADDEELKATLAENMQDIEPTFTRIKFPSGGGLAFTIPGDEEDTVATELAGVVLDHHAVNAYWKEAYSGQNNPPDCASMDGKVGFASADSGLPWAGSSRTCHDCPFNQWGSDPRGGKGRACKNMRRIYLLREGELFPNLVTLPPTSIKAWNTYVVGITSKGKRLSGVVTKIKLKKATNSTGIAYSEGVFVKGKDLPKEEQAALRAYGDQLKQHIRNQVIDASDYVVEEVPAAAAPADDDIA